MHPDITAEWADLAAPGPWSKHFEGVDTVVMLQAQIGAKERETYVRNTVTSTRYVLEAIKKVSGALYRPYQLIGSGIQG